MPVIKLETQIASDIFKCFDLSRDVDTHTRSAKHTHEQAIEGRTSGLCELGDTITWQATHFGIRQKLRVKITKFERPVFFEDEMIRGAFAAMRHQHHFEEVNGYTIMSDTFEYQVPFGWIGKIFDKLILRNYMIQFLTTRNKVIKELAEKK